MLKRFIEDVSLQQLTPSLQVGEARFSARLSANVEKHRPSRLVV
jgi:hypothetical protein